MESRAKPLDGSMRLLSRDGDPDIRQVRTYSARLPPSRPLEDGWGWNGTFLIHPTRPPPV